MPAPLDALDYLTKPERHPPQPINVAFGDETFLKRLVVTEIRRSVVGAEEGEFSVSRLDGRTASLRDVLDDLSTVALFGAGRRLVVIDDADDFVSRHRGPLEDYVARPKSTGVLVLGVQSWPKNTRLYKALGESGLQIDCKTPATAQLLKWLIRWAKQRHDARLDPPAADRLLEIVGPELGLLDQELAKLAATAGADGTVTGEMVGDLVGGWRAKTTWEMLDAALGGHARDALQQLDRLVLAGEHPVAILGQMASSMRRLAAATRLIEQATTAGRTLPLRQALQQAGFQPFLLNKAEQQLRQLGRPRASQLYRWLLEADLDLKGQSALEPRVVLERLIARLSKAAAPKPPAAARL